MLSIHRLFTLLHLILVWMLIFITPAIHAENADFPLHQSAVIQTEHLSSRLVAKTLTAPIGGQLELGLLFEHEAHWHTYWKNPGDSGLPTRIEFEFPEAFKKDITVGNIQWPTPKRFVLENVINYGYENRVLLPITLRLSPKISHQGPLTIKAKAHWLICREVCIPNDAVYTLSLPLSDTTAPQNNPQWESLFTQAKQQQPDPVLSKTAKADFVIKQDKLQIRLTIPNNTALNTWELFPENPSFVNHSTQAQWEKTATGWNITLKTHEFLTKVPKTAQFLLSDSTGTHSISFGADWDAKHSVLKTALVSSSSQLMNEPVTNTPSEAAVSAAHTQAQPTKQSTPATPAAETNSLALALLMAFLGGAILNLMPCVFPILSLKALGILKHADQPTELKLHSLFYTAGVLISFVGMASVLFLLRASGEQLGWGFQLQEPRFVAYLVLLLCGMALNFAGLFEFSPRFMGVGQQLTTTDNGKENHRSAFFTGVLACLVASPCTAPFMGTALGFAMTLPMLIGLSIFVSLGLGMASPILLIGFVPKLGRYLPRPGAWMHAFKQFMAFPLLLTVIWLLWVYGGQSSLLSMTLLLSTCVLLGFACWLFQHLPSRGVWRHIMKGIASILLLVCLYAPAYYTKQLTQHSKNSAATDHKTAHASISEKWTPERFAEAQRSGKPIFVEMTAAWCITCLANEQRALSSPEFIQALHDKNVIYLKGDWTLQDASITTYLASFGRNGVPLYVLYSGKAGASPQVLPQLLSPSIIQEAFAGI